jgi:hypothetical protein
MARPACCLRSVCARRRTRPTLVVGENGDPPLVTVVVEFPASAVEVPQHAAEGEFEVGLRNTCGRPDANTVRLTSTTWSQKS